MRSRRSVSSSGDTPAVCQSRFAQVLLTESSRLIRQSIFAREFELHDRDKPAKTPPPIPRYASPRRVYSMKHPRVLRRRIRFVSLLALALAATALIGAASPARGSMSLGTTTLDRDVVHYLSAATLLGPVPASQEVTVGVVLNNPNQAAENAYLAQLYDPSSANYQQFLDPTAFAQQFGVPASTVSAVTSWLTGGGLSVSAPEGATTYLQATGTAAQVSTLFSTPLNVYSAGGRTFYANAPAPTVPVPLPVP